MKTYCATLLRFDSKGFRREAIENLDGEVFNSKFANRNIKLICYKEDDAIMVRWKSPVLVPENTYYLDCTIAGAQNEVDGFVESISDILMISLVPNMDDPEGVQKVRSFYEHY